MESKSLKAICETPAKVARVNASPHMHALNESKIIRLPIHLAALYFPRIYRCPFKAFTDGSHVRKEVAEQVFHVAWKRRIAQSDLRNMNTSREKMHICQLGRILPGCSIIQIHGMVSWRCHAEMIVLLYLLAFERIAAHQRNARVSTFSRS